MVMHIVIIHHLKVIAYEYFLSQLCSGKRLKSENEEQNYNAVSYTGNIKYIFTIV